MLKSETNLDENLTYVSSKVLEEITCVSSKVLEEEDTLHRNMTKFCSELCSWFQMEEFFL